MSRILDAGALIALERNDRAMWQRLKLSLQAGEAPISHGGIVGQVWCGRGSRQALLARALDAIDIRSLDAILGRVAGELLARANQADGSMLRSSCWRAMATRSSPPILATSRLSLAPRTSTSSSSRRDDHGQGGGYRATTSR